MTRVRRGIKPSSEAQNSRQATGRGRGASESRRGSARARLGSEAEDHEEESNNRFERSPRRGRSSEPGGTPSRGRRASSSPGQEDFDMSDEEQDSPHAGKGWALVKERKERMEQLDEERKNRLSDFYLAEGEEAPIQFLDDEPYVLEGHMVRTRSGRFSFEPCQLHTQRHCLMCQKGIKKTWRAGFKVLDFRGNFDREKREFKYDEPVEKLWLVGQKLASQLDGFFSKKSQKPSELSLLVSSSGSGTSKSYNISLDVGDDGRMVPPERNFEEKKATLEESLQPKTDKALEAMGFEPGDF